MKFLIIPIVFLAITKLCHGGPLRLRRAAFYIANETACVVDNTVYSSGDPIPTDDPCESCKCRPPGFACVLKDCQVKPGCRAVRRAGHCCPEYVCGCEHNGRMYRDGDEIRDSKNPCYTCHCQGTSIACAFVDCLFRVDCSPEYVVGECCPRYPQCTNANSSYAAESTINPDIGTALPTSSEPDTSLLDESKVEYVIPEAPLVEEKAAPETTVDSDGASPYIPDSIDDEILERNNAGTTEKEAVTESSPVAETIEVLHDVGAEDVAKEESPDLLNTESEIKKDYVEESGEEVVAPTELPIVDASPSSETTVAGSNVEIFADETTDSQEESQATTEGSASTIGEEVEIEDNTIEKTFRSLKNFTSEGDSEQEEKEQSESPDIEKSESTKVQTELPDIEEKSESPVTEEKSETPDAEEKSESTEVEEKSESPVTEEKSETSDVEEKSESTEIEEKSDAPVTEEKSETSDVEEKSESPVTEEKSDTPEFEKSVTAVIKEEAESPENRELLDSEEVTFSSEAQDTSSAPVNELKATEHTNSPASEATIDQTTKNPESLYYVDDKISSSESSETATALVDVHEETSSQANDETTPATESKEASPLFTSEKLSETTLPENETSETPN